MNIRTVLAAAISLSALTGAANATPYSIGNPDKCPGGFDLATALCPAQMKAFHPRSHLVVTASTANIAMGTGGDGGMLAERAPHTFIEIISPSPFPLLGHGGNH